MENVLNYDSYNCILFICNILLRSLHIDTLNDTIVE
jgi:hypothetical protein